MAVVWASGIEDEPTIHLSMLVDGGSPSGPSVVVGRDWIGGDVVWLPRGRLAFLSDGGRAFVFDRGLRRVATLEGWVSSRGIAVAGSAYGVAWGRLVVAPLGGGATRLLRELGSPETYAIAHVPGARPAAVPDDAPLVGAAPARQAEPTHAGAEPLWGLAIFLAGLIGMASWATRRWLAARAARSG
jgi:hypothetical protein